jgi:hypothetical protein
MRLPRPAAWASAVALFIYAAGVSVALAFIIPLLAGLLRQAPRLAWLGMLAAWLSPIAGAAAIHAAVDRVLVGREPGSPRRHSPVGGATSWWVGVVAWATIILVTMTTAFVMLVVDPPPIAPPEALWHLAAAVTKGVSGLVRSALWIVLAAYVYELERSARDAAE